MSEPPSAPEPRRRPPGLAGRGPQKELSREEAASRISAFVYGNILVMAALVALHPDDLEGPKGVAYVVGTSASTFVAHVVAESVGFGVRTETRPDRSTVIHELRGAVPILTSATLPALLMVTALLGWVGTTTALQLAMAATVARLAGLGWVIGRLRKERTSWRTFLAGILLAVVCMAAAWLKWRLTH